MAKAKKAKVTKKVPQMTRQKLINTLRAEPLIPGRWTHDITKTGEEVNSKNKIQCIGCAVGAVITQAKRDGKLKNYSFSISTADSYNEPDKEYFKALVSGGCYLTALSDMFEMECEKQGVDSDSYEFEEALKFFNRKSMYEARKKSGKQVSEYETEEFTDKNLIKENRDAISNYNRKLGVVKRKLISFVKKNFPGRIPLQNENESMKSKALEGTDYNCSGEKCDFDY